MASSNREPRQRFKPNKSQGASSVGGPSGDGPRARKRAWWIAAAIILVIAAAAVTGLIGSGSLSTFVAGQSGTPAATATFVGSETCAGCHQPEAKLWQTSQHKKAMDHATDRSVLGDFSGVTFEYYGVTSRFFRKDGKFFVETDGPDGKLATFEIKYTFGRRSVAAISDRVSGRTHSGAVDRLGFAAEGPRRPALVSSLPRRRHPPRRRSALDQAEPELEFHVRRVPFDRRAQELRCGSRSLRDHVG